MRGRRATAVLAVVVLAGAAAGCGGGNGSARLSKAQYEQRVQADAKALDQATSGIAANTTSLTSLKSAVAQAQKGIEKAAADLDSLKPPAEAEAANAAFVTALREIDTALGALATAADSGDMASVVVAVQKLGTSKAVKAAETASAQLKKLGYDLGSLGG